MDGLVEDLVVWRDNGGETPRDTSVCHLNHKRHWMMVHSIAAQPQRVALGHRHRSLVAARRRFEETTCDYTRWRVGQPFDYRLDSSLGRTKHPRRYREATNSPSHKPPKWSKA